MHKHQATTTDFKTAPMAQFVKKLQIIGSVGFFGLIIYYPILFFVLDTNANSLAYITLCLFWLPLLPAIKGILQGNPYTFAWSNFVIMWCYLHGLTAIWTFEGNKLYIVIELVLLTAAFIGNTYFARFRGREMGLALPKIKELKEQEKAQFEAQSNRQEKD
ncbi:DUF2069 domain-containing protein [Psychrosphaera aestuarii]|uniref:DUF2069 domain-containing protein n=1 Tax=Psychrosphaera aestuarii TaxID=1266052 RepID=UPI001B3423C8|nr:DUF2069 domain-containing protein [Psychrosphaera aestuarii]